MDPIGVTMPYELLEEAPQQESTLGMLGRTGARTLARGAEAIAGLPGDIASGVLGLANYGISKATGKPGPLPERVNLGPALFGPIGVGVDIASRVLGKESPVPQINLPTSEDIHQKVTKPLTGEFLEPQGKGEQFYDDIIGDAATLLIPVKGKVPFVKAAVGALGRSAIGNTAKWAAEEVSGSPLVGAGAKIGSMALAGTFGGRKELSKLKNQSYQDAFSKIPENAKFNFSPEKSQIEKLAKSLTKGDRPDKAFVLDRLRSINNITNKAGKGSIQEAINLKQDWNKYLADPSLPKSSRDAIKQAVGIVNDGIKRYGETNPGFFKPYQIGEELTGALQSTNFIQKVLSKHPVLQDSMKNPLMKHLLFGGAAYGIGKMSVPALVGIGGGVVGARESAKAYQLLSRSPVARRYYKDVIEATLKNDTKAIAKNLARLDKAANDFTAKHPDFELLPEEGGEQGGRYEFID